MEARRGPASLSGISTTLQQAHGESSKCKEMFFYCNSLANPAVPHLVCFKLSAGRGMRSLCIFNLVSRCWEVNSGCRLRRRVEPVPNPEGDRDGRAVFYDSIPFQS
jgi:hypothetical protein